MLRVPGGLASRRVQLTHIKDEIPRIQGLTQVCSISLLPVSLLHHTLLSRANAFPITRKHFPLLSLFRVNCLLQFLAPSSLRYPTSKLLARVHVFSTSSSLRWATWSRVCSQLLLRPLSVHLNIFCSPHPHSSHSSWSAQSELL